MCLRAGCRGCGALGRVALGPAVGELAFCVQWALCQRTRALLTNTLSCAILSKRAERLFGVLDHALGLHVGGTGGHN